MVDHGQRRSRRRSACGRFGGEAVAQRKDLLMRVWTRGCSSGRVAGFSRELVDQAGWMPRGALMSWTGPKRGSRGAAALVVVLLAVLSVGGLGLASPARVT